MPLELHAIDYNQIAHFSKLFCAYTAHNPVLQPFISDFPTWESFQNQIEKKQQNFPKHVRLLLQNRLKAQMGGLALSESQKQNLEKLSDEKTFSVSCGHQLNFAGGPVYMAFKILTVIKLAEELKVRFPQYHFVPIHWLATEDHDLEEIQSFRFFGEKHNLELNETGAVGKMTTGTLRNQMAEITYFPAWMSASYVENIDLTSATKIWLQHVFGDKGLLMIDGDDKAFKEVLKPWAVKELLDSWVEKDLLDQSKKLEEAGFKPQIHGREINLFYMNGNERLRLEKNGDRIQTVEGKYQWTTEEARTHFEKHPEQLSPNVAFRPVYSQMLMPDLAFIGGPAETAYWLQLGKSFETANTTFPLLIPRFSALYIDENKARKIEKIGLKASDVMKEEKDLKRDLLLPDDVLPELETPFSKMIEWAQSVDVTMVPAIKAEIHKMEKTAAHLQKRVLKASERKNEIQVGQLRKLLTQLFPGGGLQERTETWLSFLVTDPDWLNKIYTEIDPLDLRFQVISETA